MFEDYTTVQEAAGGDIVLVGEEHGNKRSASLGERVLGYYDTPVVAVERFPPASVPSHSAMGAMREYAEQERVPLVKIDKPYSFKSEITSVANTFSHPIEEDGDLNPEAITDARNAVRSEFGDEVHDRMYGQRESVMAENLLAARDEFGTPVVAAVGAFHVPALREEIEGASATTLTDKRVVQYNDKQLA